MKYREIYNSAQLMETIQEIGFLPLLDCGIRGYSAEEMVADDCRYVILPDGGWGWALLTTPELLIGREACLTDRTPDESFQRMAEHLTRLLPTATETQIRKLLK